MEESFYFIDTKVSLSGTSKLDAIFIYFILFFFLASATLIIGTVKRGNTSRHRNVSTRVLQTCYSVFLNNTVIHIHSPATQNIENKQ